jgi:predicted nuclease of restriction endonuclease-like (RecB) superfamily
MDGRMSQPQPSPLAGLPNLVKQIKARIQEAQTRAIFAANAELVRLYWDVGRLIDDRQRREGWGAGVIPRLTRELRNELPEEKGFSERNIGRMIAFFRAYPDPSSFEQPGAAPSPTRPILPQPAAKLAMRPKVPQPAAKFPSSLLWSTPWFHHIVLLEKVKDVSVRLWYMQQAIANGWSRNVLVAMIHSETHRRQGRAITNFDERLPAPQSDLARETLKDPYIFDFLTLEEPFHERELETDLLRQLERFLLELGRGFAFVGRQLHLEVGDGDFYVDLLFYHLKLRSFVVIDLKKGAFKPEYAGKMNFYLNVVDDHLRHESDAPSIGLILCQQRNRVVAEYTLRGVSKPIGISEYEITRALPPSLRSALPSVEELEAELTESAPPSAAAKTRRTRAGKASSPAAKNPRKKGARR